MKNLDTAITRIEKYRKNPEKHSGSSFDDFLKETGDYEEVKAQAFAEIFAMLIKKEMEDQKITKAELARRMRTGPTAIARLLNPKNPSMTLRSMTKAALALGKEINVSLV